MIKSKIDQDLKAAMLASDKELVSVLRGLKSTIQYAEVEARDKSSLDDETIIQLLRREVKKRAEAAELYEKSGDVSRADKEKYETRIIESYLPKQMSEAEISEMVDQVISESNIELTRQNMGKIISAVKEKSAGRAAGGTIAKTVQQRIGDG